MTTAVKHLTSRWQQEWRHYEQLVTAALLKNKKLSSLHLPKTETGLLDLRGYSGPKDYVEVKDNSSGKTNRVIVKGNVYIKKQVFESADFSGADFEMCRLENCIFINCLFDEANFNDASFEGCEFENIRFVKTNFQHAAFSLAGILFRKKKINFRNIIFDKATLSNSFITSQGFDHCHFTNCTTNFMDFDDCRLNNVKFTGKAREVFFEKCNHQNTDLSEAHVESLSLINQPLDGILFPEGDSYYTFKHKTEELSRIDYSHLDEKQKQEIEFIKKIWLDKNPEADFADINYFDPPEKETGKWLIRQLKENASINR